jgi:hypothetical protein
MFKSFFFAQEDKLKDAGQEIIDGDDNLKWA